MSGINEIGLTLSHNRFGQPCKSVTRTELYASFLKEFSVASMFHPTDPCGQELL
jgi:hypothetical protein